MKFSNENNRFRDFIGGFDARDETLPLVHTTRAKLFDKILDGETLNPTHCDQFEEDILYLFYGRPAYRTPAAVSKRLEFNWPFSFVIDPSKVKSIRAVYPMDTGAFALDLYKGFFDPTTDRDDFALEGALVSAKKVTSFLYSSDRDYFTNDPKPSLTVPSRQFEAQAIKALAELPLSVQPEHANHPRDERSNSIEVQVDEVLSIKDTVLRLIAPEPWRIEPDFIEAADRWGLEDKLVFYDVTNVREDTNWVGLLYGEVSRVYKDLGIFDD